MKKISALLLATVLLLTLAGCGKTPTASTNSEPDTSSVDLYPSSTASFLSSPKAESTVTASQVNTATAQTFKVDAALVAKYYDYFDKEDFRNIPRFDFNTVNDITDDNKVIFAIKCTKPLSYTTVSGLATYDCFDIQATLLKYLGVQFQNVNALSTYPMNLSNLYFYDSQRYSAFFFFYKLTALSVDDKGVYTGVFDVYKRGYSTHDLYQLDKAANRAGILAASVDTSVYVPFSTVTMQFVEMKETSGTSYYKYISLHTVQK